MPVNANKNQAAENNVKADRENKSIRKAPGTRLGTVQDWRGENNSSGKNLARHGGSIRDGR